MAHSARAVANEFIRLGESAGNPLTPLQIMKLVYLAHGWMLAIYDQPLVEEDFEAWRYGPVVPDLYQAMKIYRADALREPLVLGSIAQIQDGGRIRFVPIEPRPFSVQETWVIEAVYQHFGSWPASKLIQVTHQLGSPWHKVWAPGSWGRKLSTPRIKRFFKGQMQQ